MRYAAALTTQYRDGKSDSVALINVIRHTEFFSHAKAQKLAKSFAAESPMQKTKFEGGASQFIEWRTMSEKEFKQLRGEW